MLQVAFTPPKERLTLSRYVNMDIWGFSDGRPMYTWGASPCLNVVVHRVDRGCFSHIGQYPTIRGASDDLDVLLSKTQLYHKACFTILSMIQRIGSTSNIEIWLGAGHAYWNASKFSARDIPRYDFLDYLVRFLREANCDPEIIDDRRTGPLDKGKFCPGVDPGPGDVMYDPKAGRVYYLTSAERLTAQESSLTKPDVFGQCI